MKVPNILGLKQITNEEMRCMLSIFQAEKMPKEDMLDHLNLIDDLLSIQRMGDNLVNIGKRKREPIQTVRMALDKRIDKHIDEKYYNLPSKELEFGSSF